MSNSKGKEGINPVSITTVVPQDLGETLKENLQFNETFYRRHFLKLTAALTGLTSILTIKWLNPLLRHSIPDVETPPDQVCENLAEEFFSESNRLLEIYQIRNNLHMLDTLKIAQLKNGMFIGVSHYDEGMGSFENFTSEISMFDGSENREHLMILEKHASQPYIEIFPNGKILVMYEKDNGTDAKKSTRSWIEMKIYNNFDDLKNNKEVWELKILDLKKFGIDCNTKGTPTLLEGRIGEDISDSLLKIGFHYYDNDAEADRNAVMVIKNGEIIMCEPYKDLNKPFENNGFGGNIGGREYVEFGKENNDKRGFIIIEAQQIAYDMKSWRIFFYDLKNNKYFQVNFENKYNIKAFANPKISKVKLNDRDVYVLTLYAMDGDKKGPCVFVYDAEKIDGLTIPL